MNDWKAILLDIAPVAVPIAMSLYALYFALTCVALKDFIRQNARGGRVYVSPILSFLVMGIGYLYIATVMPDLYRGLNLAIGITHLFLAFMTVRASIPDYSREFEAALERIRL